MPTKIKTLTEKCWGTVCVVFNRYFYFWLIFTWLWVNRFFDLPNDLSYNERFDYDDSPNVVSPTLSVCKIVDSPTFILPNVCLPNQPLTKRAFIANLPDTMSICLMTFHLIPNLTLQVRLNDTLDEMTYSWQTDIRQTIRGKMTFVEPSSSESTFSHMFWLETLKSI